jgi:uncharacterized protein YjiS (DUF1127 family)
MRTPFRRLSHRYQRWQRYRRTLQELEMMSDRDLMDLGVNPHDIKRIAREAAGYP